MIIGTGLLIVYPIASGNISGEEFTAGREMLFASGIKDLPPPGVTGIMLTGMLAALASTIDTHLTWRAGYWSNDLYLRILNRAWLRLLSMSPLSTLVVVTVTLFTPPEKEDILTEFYRKVSPPGFWKKTAKASGDSSNDPLKRFLKGMYLTLTISISLYFILVGCGKLVLPDPNGSIIHAVLYLGAGLLVIPAWAGVLRKALMKEEQ